MGSHSGTYTSPPQRAVFKGLLFDFDGTLGFESLLFITCKTFPISTTHTQTQCQVKCPLLPPLCSNLFKGLTQLSPETQQMRLLSTGTCKISHSNRQCSSQLIFCSIGKEIGVDPNVILQTSHGRRSIDVLKILSPEKANWECQSILINR